MIQYLIKMFFLSGLSILYIVPVMGGELLHGFGLPYSEQVNLLEALLQQEENEREQEANAILEQLQQEIEEEFEWLQQEINAEQGISAAAA